MELTPRQQEIAERVAKGMQANEIAADLGISTQAVKNHKGRIYDKLGVRNAVELTLVLNGNPDDIPDLVA